MAWLFTTQSFIQIGQTIAKLQKKQKYGNPDLKKSNFPFAFLWQGESSPKVLYKSGSPLQSYSIEKHMATLNKRIKGIMQGPMTIWLTTQSFVKIRPGISECIAGQTDWQTSGQMIL